VLERLYDYYSSIRKQRPTKRMSESLNAYAWIPGIPQITYLQFSNNDSDLVIAVLSNVLENMDLSDIEIRVVVNANKEIIRKHLLLDTLELSRDRKNKLEKWLDIGSKPQK